MNSKEKAKELVTRFYPEVQWKLGQEDCLDRAKRCALIAVDEVLKAAFYAKDEVYNFYIEVKIELENYDVKR
jgi:hypothetical protein